MLHLWLPWDYFLLGVVTAEHTGGLAQGGSSLTSLAFSDYVITVSSTKTKCSLCSPFMHGGPLMPTGQKIVVAKVACTSLPDCNSCFRNVSTSWKKKGQ